MAINTSSCDNQALKSHGQHKRNNQSNCGDQTPNHIDNMSITINQVATIIEQTNNQSINHVASINEIVTINQSHCVKQSIRL